MKSIVIAPSKIKPGLQGQDATPIWLSPTHQEVTMTGATSPITSANALFAVYGALFFVFGLFLLVYAEPSELRLCDHSVEHASALRHYAGAALLLAACCFGYAAIMHYVPQLMVGVAGVAMLAVFIAAIGLMIRLAYRGTQLDPVMTSTALTRS